jgi:hypothetical protein
MLRAEGPVSLVERSQLRTVPTPSTVKEIP